MQAVIRGASPFPSIKLAETTAWIQAVGQIRMALPATLSRCAARRVAGTTAGLARAACY